MCERKRRRRSFLSASGESGFGWAPGAEAREVGGECVRVRLEVKGPRGGREYGHFQELNREQCRKEDGLVTALQRKRTNRRERYMEKG